MKINDLCKVCYENAESKGFWEDIKEIYLEGMPARHFNNAIAARLALIHSEVSEALEAIRKGDKENFKEELADIVIRVFDLCGGLSIDLEHEIEKKMEKNKQRPYKHGKEF
ncbi:MAG: MazG nucleotide pyrophosphohydrolase domain protein [Caloramator sp.]|jgi:NTP pyrophosphatase (non-canonical NTP hydrolase)|uniref:MazG nucleotide pyrophosphohydrolase domain-containing protein n=1 Tax=Caloramator sp. TaxID=1871330 RepID=UPI001D873B25|nr:MazG nucleotide pyrophosphohydrolase domain-containing protein [Caloramator sp.]MBZ4662791.1 MazG nucleotide pyrophosphohydrolase domain protein [Caloramator sp.]